MLKFSLIQGWVFRLMFCRSGFCKLWSRGHEGNSDWRCKARECAQEGPEGAKGCQTCHQEEMKKKELTKELSTKLAAIHKSIQEQQHMKCHNTTTTEYLWARHTEILLRSSESLLKTKLLVHWQNNKTYYRSILSTWSLWLLSSLDLAVLLSF